MLTDDDRKLLPEYLGECWHESFADECNQCKNCSVWKKRFTEWNRTFTTMPDLIALYEAIHGEGKWDDFFWWIGERSPSPFEAKANAWLFCLNAPDQIPERCKMVAEWMKGK